jgi:hypothetical protein
VTSFVPIALIGEATVGVFLKEAERVSNLNPKHFTVTRNIFRMLTAQIRGFAKDKSKYCYRHGKNDAWLKKVEATQLGKITPATASDWKVAYLMRAGIDPKWRLEVDPSFNAALRHCKNLLSANIIHQPNSTTSDSFMNNINRNTPECQTLDVKSSAMELGVCKETVRRLVKRKILQKLPVCAGF